MYIKINNMTGSNGVYLENVTLVQINQCNSILKIKIRKWIQAFQQKKQQAFDKVRDQTIQKIPRKLVIKKKSPHQAVVLHTFNPSTQEAKEGGSL